MRLGPGRRNSASWRERPAREERSDAWQGHACKIRRTGVLFYASDNDDAEPMRGSAHILMMDDRDQTRALFERLSAGGRVPTPLGVQPWGDYYGKLTDRFGVQWMLNCSSRTS